MSISLSEAVSKLAHGFRKAKVRELRKLSNRCTESLGLTESEDMFNLALLSYVLAKIIEKPRYWEAEQRGAFTGVVEKALNSSQRSLKKNDMSTFRKALSDVVAAIDAMDVVDKRYVRDLFHKSRVKVASTLYAQGFSLGYASELAGADKHEVLSYAGETLISDRAGRTKSVEHRLGEVRKLFK